MCHLIFLVFNLKTILCLLICWLQDKACEALEVFDELLETEVAIIVPHLKPFLQFCLQVSSSQNTLSACTHMHTILPTKIIIMLSE